MSKIKMTLGKRIKSYNQLDSHFKKKHDIMLS